MAFTVKEKEPKLSLEMQELINRSHQDGNGQAYSDIERYKYKIMKMLTSNSDILYTLHNEELGKNVQYTYNEKGEKIETLNGDAYRDVNIFNFLKIPDVQSTVKNFICFDVNDIEQPRYRDDLIIKNIIFRTISHEDDYITDWGIARQDLLAIIIQSVFDWSNVFGIHLEKVSDRGRIAENGYYYREFIYETTIPNNINNKINGGLYGRK